MIWYVMIWYDMIWWYDIFVNCNWVVTRWQQYSTHLHTNSTQNNTINTKQYTDQHISLIRQSAGRAPSLWGIPWHLPYKWGKSTENPQSVFDSPQKQKTTSSFHLPKCPWFSQELRSGCIGICLEQAATDSVLDWSDNNKRSNVRTT